MATLNDYKNYIPADFLELIEAAQAFSEIEGAGGSGFITITEHIGGGETKIQPLGCKWV